MKAMQTVQQTQRQRSTSSTTSGSVAATTTAESSDQLAATNLSPPTRISHKRPPPEGGNPNQPYGYADWGNKRFKTLHDREHQRPPWTDEEKTWIATWCEEKQLPKENMTCEKMRLCIQAICNSEIARSIFHPHHMCNNRIDNVFRQFKN
jgi:hypothetical protein